MKRQPKPLKAETLREARRVVLDALGNAVARASRHETRAKLARERIARAAAERHADRWIARANVLQRVLQEIDAADPEKSS